ALTEAVGRKVVAIALTPEQALARGLHPGWVRSQEWTNEVGYQADIPALARWDVPLTSFASWARRHHSSIDIDA
ncbi:MAG TPA: NmrA/HSCARG family protein, partial [Ramlibacter sp.]|nr:NmrA/HSCARG family protein [Ramlibacter sp.]